MVASDVATTCTSRIAMNIPMHIMAKPTQTIAVTEPGGLFSVAEIIASPVEDSGGRPARYQPVLFGTNRTRMDMQIRMGVLRCPILGQSDSGQQISAEIRPI